MRDERSEVILGNISRLTIMSPSDPEVYYICQPSSIQQRMLANTQKQNNANTSTQPTKTISIPAASGSKWSSDDH